MTNSSNYHNSNTSSDSTAYWYSGTTNTSSPRYRRVVGRYKEVKPTFHCHSCRKSHGGNGKTHPDYPDLLACDKCIKERNKHLILVMDEEKI